MQTDEHIRTLCLELTSGHTHPEEYTAASKQWGTDGESSSSVIVTSLHCTQIARSSQAWEMYREYTVANGYCYPVLNPSLNWVQLG